MDDTDQKDLARFFNLEVSSAKWVLRNMRLDHEVRVAAAIMSAANFGAGTGSAVAYTVALNSTVNFPSLVVRTSISTKSAPRSMAFW